MSGVEIDYIEVKAISADETFPEVAYGKVHMIYPSPDWQPDLAPGIPKDLHRKYSCQVKSINTAEKSLASIELALLVELQSELEQTAQWLRSEIERRSAET